MEIICIKKIREEPKSDQAAVIGGDSEVYEASHFVPKLFMQSVNAAVLAESSPHVFGDDRNPAICSPRSSANPSRETHRASKAPAVPFVRACVRERQRGRTLPLVAAYVLESLLVCCQPLF